MEFVQHVTDEVGGECDDLAWKLTHDWLKTFEKVFVVEIVQHLYVDLENVLEVTLSAVKGWLLT